MCLLDFIEFKKIEKENSVTGYREWKVEFDCLDCLRSINQNYYWLVEEGPHKVEDSNSGLYSYNYYYNYIKNYCNSYYNYIKNYCNYNNSVEKNVNNWAQL